MNSAIMDETVEVWIMHFKQQVVTSLQLVDPRGALVGHICLLAALPRDVSRAQMQPV